MTWTIAIYTLDHIFTITIILIFHKSISKNAFKIEIRLEKYCFVNRHSADDFIVSVFLFSMSSAVPETSFKRIDPWIQWWTVLKLDNIDNTPDYNSVYCTWLLNIVRNREGRNVLSTPLTKACHTLNARVWKIRLISAKEFVSLFKRYLYK